MAACHSTLLSLIAWIILAEWSEKVDCFLERATLTYENTSELKSGDVQ
jgi:hypothetical protein